MPQGRKRRADDGEKRMKKECTEQDLQRFVQDAKLAFEDVTLTELDEDSSRYWQDDGLMVDYELRNGQVGCVLRRQIFVEGKVWELQMTAPLAGSGLPEDRMTPRERELCREDMNHDFLTGVFNRRYFETEFCTRLDEWADQHRCASLALVALDNADALRAGYGPVVMSQLVCFVANQWTGGLPPGRQPVCDRLCGQELQGAGGRAAHPLWPDAARVCDVRGPDEDGAHPAVHCRGLHQ